MEPSAALRKICWRNLWQLVFLAVSILSSCFLLIEGQGVTQIQIKVQPERPTEGNNVTLTTPFNLSGARSCRWFRGRTIDPEGQILSYLFPEESEGPAFTQRETTGVGCFLHITKLTARDNGIYTLNVEGLGINAVGYVSIVASEYLISPRLESPLPNGMVAENSSAILNCHTSNQPDVSVFWSKNDKSFPTTRGELSNRNRTLTLSQVSKSDTGTYRCWARNLISYNVSNSIQILVTYGPEMKLNPEGKIYKTLNSDLLVECLVDSVPLAKLQWFFNGIEQKENGSIFKVRIKNQSNRGSYTCRATNPFNNHTDERSCNVIVRKDYLSAATIVGSVTGSVAGVALVSGLVYLISKKFIRVKVQPPTSSGEVEETPQAD